MSYDTIGAYIDVQRQLGVHCMEVDYQRALEIARPKRGLHYQREVGDRRGEGNRLGSLGLAYANLGEVLTVTVTI